MNDINNQTIFYHIFDLTPGIYEIHSTGEPDKSFGILQVSDNGNIYDYETKQPYTQLEVISIAHWEEDNYQNGYYLKIK